MIDFLSENKFIDSEISEVNKFSDVDDIFIKLNKSLDKYDSIMGDKNIESVESYDVDNKEKLQISLEKYENFMEDSADNNYFENRTVEALYSNIDLYNEVSMKWPPDIVDNISSIEEYKVYEKANLSVENIDGKNCLIKNDIDWEKQDFMGRSNADRVKQGLSPIGATEKPVELHHIGQHADSPLAELTPEEHRGKGNDTILHNKTKESEIDREVFARERSEHWSSRLESD